MTGRMTSTSRCWLPAPTSANPRPATFAAPYFPSRPQLRATSPRISASSSNGAGPSLNGSTAVDAGKQRLTSPRDMPIARPGYDAPPSAAEGAEDGGWLETAAARLAEANGGNLYATSPPVADQQQPGSSAAASAVEAAIHAASLNSNSVTGDPRDGGAEGAATRRGAQMDAGAGGALSSPGNPQAAETVAAVGSVDAAPVSMGEVQPWGRTVAQALAAGEQTRRRHDEASALCSP